MKWNTVKLYNRSYCVLICGSDIVWRWVVGEALPSKVDGIDNCNPPISIRRCICVHSTQQTRWLQICACELDLFLADRTYSK